MEPTERIELSFTAYQAVVIPLYETGKMVLVPGVEPGHPQYKRGRLPLTSNQQMERRARIELAFPAWKAGTRPLCQRRVLVLIRGVGPRSVRYEGTILPLN